MSTFSNPTGTDEQYYPPVGFHFNVRLVSALSLGSGALGGNIDNSFKEVSGITASVKTEKINEGGENRFSYTVPVKNDFSNLVLKRGYVSATSEFGEWVMERMESPMNEPIESKHVMVSLLDSDGDVLTAWFFVSAWPVKSEIGNFDAMENKYLVESMELSYLYFEQIKANSASAMLKLARKMKDIV